MLYQTDSESIRNAKIEDIKELLAESEYILQGILANAERIPVNQIKYLGQLYNKETESIINNYKLLISSLKSEIARRSGANLPGIIATYKKQRLTKHWG